jgi:Domain of unknown function (DUF4381)
MTAEELLLELKDITPPPEPAWWLIPPVYLLGLGVIIGIAVLAWLTLRHRKTNRLANWANQDLQRIRALYSDNRDDHQLGLELSRWLKQVSILAFPQHQAESFTGEPWLKFLDQSIAGNEFSSGHGKVFGGSVYRQQVNLDARQLVALCEHWLVVVKPLLLQRSRD